MKQIVNKWLKIVQPWIKGYLSLSSFCELCLQPSFRDIALCLQCEAKLPRLGRNCKRCALKLSQSNELCFQCLNHPAPYERLTALFDYDWPISGFIGKLKYAGHLHFANMLGELMHKHLSCQHPIDCLVAVPLHADKQCKRGFNQAIELAKRIAKLRKIPLDTESCQKVINTQAQATLSARQRRKNVGANAFVIAPDFRAKHVLVIDDVVTTGATVRGLASALKAHGVSTVEIWAVCRTSL